jgi:hypothetical protein
MKETLRIINRMKDDQIIGRYAIGGAVGATFYIEPSATLDVDIFVTLQPTPGVALVSLAPIYDYLTRRGCTAEGEHILVGTWPVQFLVANKELEEEAITSAVEADVEGVKTWVMTAEHLTAIALKTGRNKDYGRILQFLEQGCLDRNKLESILDRHGLAERWKKFRQRYIDEQ